MVNNFKKALLEKLEKQRAAAGNTSTALVLKVEKIKQKRPPILNITKKQQSQVSTEEKEIRTALKNLLNGEDLPLAFTLYSNKNRLRLKEEFPEEDIAELLEKSWQELDLKDQRDYLLDRLKNSKTAAWTRRKFIESFANLSVELQDDFIERYLNQTENYTTFYEKWLNFEDVSSRLQNYLVEESKAVTTEYSKARAEDIRRDLHDEAVEYAREHEVEDIKRDDRLESVEKLSYYDILRHFAGDDQEALAKLHRKIAKDYTKLASTLGIANPKELSMANLADKIARAERILFAKVDKAYLDDVLNMSEKRLKREARKIGVEDVEEKTPQVLQTLLIKNEARQVNSVFERAKEKGIANPEDYPYEELVEKVHELEAGQRHHTQFYEIPQEVESEEERRALIGKIIKITGEDRSMYERLGRKNLAHKLAELTGKDVSRYINLPRHEIVRKLVKLTGQEPETFSKLWTVEALRKKYKELESGQAFWQEEIEERPQGEMGKHIKIQKCIDIYQQYKWINAKVMGVWLSNAGEDYTEFSRFIDGENFFTINRRTFYKALPNFQYIFCDNPQRFSQRGQILTYHAPVGDVEFVVAYHVTPSGNASSSTELLTVGNGLLTGETILIQNEELFAKQLEYIKKERLRKEGKVEDVLKSRINEDSIKLARKTLGKALQEVAPKVQDYKKEDTYVFYAIESVTKHEYTNEEFFSKIADVIAYLDIPSANTFRHRVKEEYYLPQILLMLSPEDKLPEIFSQNSGTSEETKELIASHVKARVYNIVRDLGRSLMPKDATAHARLPYYIPEPSNDLRLDKLLSKNVCVNHDDLRDIRPEDLTLYKDPEDDKVYCLDIKKLSANFSQNNFNNPETGKQFDKKFIRRYTIQYKDKETGEKYVFPYVDLFKNFSKGNTINKITGKVFDPAFVQSVLTGEDIRNRKFHRLDSRLLTCQNPQDVNYIDLEDIIYYKDPEDDSVYCFTIENVAEIIAGGGINPHTGRKFSNAFSKKFRQMFSIDLHKKMKEVHKEEEENKEEDKEEKKTEKLIIENLWDLVDGSITSLYNDEMAQAEVVKKEDREEESVESQEEDKESQESEEEDKEEKDDEESSESSESSDSSDESSESSESDDEEEEPKKEKKKDAEMAFDKVITSQKCQKCEKESKDTFKSLGYKDNKPEVYHFCSLGCIENYAFPRFKKTKGKKPRS